MLKVNYDNAHAFVINVSSKQKYLRIEMPREWAMVVEPQDIPRFLDLGDGDSLELTDHKQRHWKIMRLADMGRGDGRVEYVIIGKNKSGRIKRHFFINEDQYFLLADHETPQHRVYEMPAHDATMEILEHFNLDTSVGGEAYNFVKGTLSTIHAMGYVEGRDSK